PAAWRDRHRHSGTHRRRPHHRAVRRAQSREALAYGAGDHPAPLSLRRPGAETKRLDLAALEVDTTMTEDHLTGLVTEVFGLGPRTRHHQSRSGRRGLATCAG